MKTKLNKELLLLLPNEVKSMNLPPKANEILCQFIAMADKDGWCYSTVEGLAHTLNCSKTTIMSNLKVLENRNLIIERVTGKRGTATRFKINLKENDSTESSNDSTEYSTESSNNSTECNNSTNNSTECSTELKTFIEEVITLKINELKNDIILELKNEILNELRSLFNNDSTIKENKRKENNIKQINNINNIENIDINKKENIEIDLNKDTDTSTCMYKRRKNDYESTLDEDENDYNQIVENTKVEGIGSNSDGNTSKTKKIFYSLKGSTLKFSYFEALEYVSKNNLNFDECFKKVEVLV